MLQIQDKKNRYYLIKTNYRCLLKKNCYITNQKNIKPKSKPDSGTNDNFFPCGYKGKMPITRICSIEDQGIVISIGDGIAKV
jgi:hypothetical protein